MKTFHRILAVLLALVMSLSVIGVAASAATIFDTSVTSGSLTIHKLEKGENAAAEVPSTGRALETLPTGYTSMGGVEFTVYQVLTMAQFEEYLANTLKKGDEVVTALNVSDYYNATTGVVTNFAGEPVTGTAQKTDATTGKTTFSLDLGVYLVIESDYPDKVTKAMDPFLVSIPMTDPANENEWLYDVTVYPKNSTAEGTVTVEKYGEDGTTALNGVKFNLKKLNGTDWEEVVIDNATEWTITNGKIEFTNLAYGTYQLIETDTAAGYILDARPIEFTISSEDGTISCTENLDTVELTGNNTKALTIKITNEKPDADKTLADGSEDANAGIGDTVSYKVTVDVPENITAMKTFVLTDTPSNLRDTVSTVKVNNTADADSDMFAVTAAGDGFTITFDTSKMGSVAGTTITVTYDAVVQAGAASGTALNTVDLTYSNKIHSDSSTSDDDGDKNHIKDSGIVYTYKINITKYKDSAEAANVLGGVQFQVYDKKDSDTPLRFRQHAKLVGSYELYTGTTQAITELETASDGTLEIVGLDAGTYYLKEIKTAEGYNLLKDMVEVNLNVDTVTEWETDQDWVKAENGSWTLVKETNASTTYTVNGENQTVNYVSQTIINKKGFNLPATGGLGTLMFIIIGGVLIAGGVSLIAGPSKKRSV